jgi:hypothetical protein
MYDYFFGKVKLLLIDKSNAIDKDYTECTRQGYVSNLFEQYVE